MATMLDYAQQYLPAGTPDYLLGDVMSGKYAFDIQNRVQTLTTLPQPLVTQNWLQRLIGAAPGRYLPGTAVATESEKAAISSVFAPAIAGVAAGGTVGGFSLTKALGSGMVLGGVGLALAGQEVRAMALPGVLGKVFSFVGKAAKGILGIGGGAVAAGVGGAAVGAVAARAIGKGGKRRRHRRGLSMKEVKDLMMMKAVMGPGCAKSPAFQLAMMKAMG